MSLISLLQRIVEDSRSEYESIMAEIAKSEGKPFFSLSEVINGGKNPSAAKENLLAAGDNLDFMKRLLGNGYGEQVSLIYIDPPFFSKSDYEAVLKLSSAKVKDLPAVKLFAYHDSWEHGMESYLRMLTTRFFLMRELLAEDGCFWIHLDWHVVHYVKIILDEVFGDKNFVNEVIWQYKSGGTSKRHYSRKHDTLLFYGKTGKYYFKPQTEKSYNRGYKPYRFKGVKEYKDEIGWYTLVNMKDVWQIDMVGRTSGERTGYATQKPEALIERILESCSEPGDFCADFFAGSGTLGAVADRTGRRFIICDKGKVAAVNAIKRLSGAGASFSVLEEAAGKSGGKGASLDIRAEISKLDLSEKRMLEIELNNYRLEADEFPTDEDGRKILKQLLKEDSLSLLEYWSIDFDYDGKLHNGDVFFTRDRDILETRCRKIGTAFGRISIMAVDVFGNRYKREFDFSEDS